MQTVTKISLETKFASSNPNFAKQELQYKLIPHNNRLYSKPSDTPGPGSYNVTSKLTHSISFPKTKRILLERPAETPGPGLYNIPTLTFGPRYTISPNRWPSKSPTSPGPGHYDIQSNTDRPKSIVFTRSRRRLITVDSEVPGPGHYTQRSDYFSQKISFTKAAKATRSRPSSVGPGSYDIQTRNKIKFAYCKSLRKSPF